MRDARQLENVSRETLDRLHEFQRLLLKWNKKINLIARSTESEVWTRHILDSLQIYKLYDIGSRWVDLGSGGGFPGLIVAILARVDAPSLAVTLVESDRRKAAFLRTAIRELSLSAMVVTKRIEDMPPANADVVSARALANLDHLLGFASRHLSSKGTALFMKGENWENEVEFARKSWSFEIKAHQSITSADAAILEIKELQRV